MGRNLHVGQHTNSGACLAFRPRWLVDAHGNASPYGRSSSSYPPHQFGIVYHIACKEVRVRHEGVILKKDGILQGKGVSYCHRYVNIRDSRLLQGGHIDGAAGRSVEVCQHPSCLGRGQ